MNIGIVGSSKASNDIYYNDVYDIIKNLVDEYNDITINSGGSIGIDTIVNNVCNNEGIKIKVFPPSKPEWNEYKIRNKNIAESSELVISIALKGKGYCYHCNKDTHEKTAGCWTRNYAEKIGKQVRTIII